MLAREIRDKWIKFFTSKTHINGELKAHKHIVSSSLVPDNPTLLLTAAGMVQFVPIFMGAQQSPEPPRAVTVQKCVRVGGKDSDLNNIGRTTRHHSFFEMLGNFSFGDYFKREAITWAWQFVTEELKLPADRLYISVFAGDEINAFDSEAHAIWLELLTKHDANLSTSYSSPDADGLAPPALANRIWRLSRKDNFWGPPGTTGPCGPCSEIYYDLGPDFRDFGHDERFVEIWNLVFMQFEKTEDGSYIPLAKCNIDTGAGLERIATILQGVHNSFETDELARIKSTLAKGFNEAAAKPKLEIKYRGISAKSDAERKIDLYLKIVTDHLRCLAFLIADGVRPSNLGRGYVLRMIIRRAGRFALILTGSAEPQLYQYTDLVVDVYGSFYPELKASRDLIRDICHKEEEQFAKTISKGLVLLEAEIAKAKSLDGNFVFDLYSTYGFPLELTEEIAAEQGVTIDLVAYEAAKTKHSEASSTGAFAVAAVDKAKLYGALAAELAATQFLGYEVETAPVKVLAIVSPDGHRLETITAAETKTPEAEFRSFQLIFDCSPFYAESGGQEGDRGKLVDESASLDVSDTKKFQGLFLHQVSFATAINVSKISIGDKFVGVVDSSRRQLTRYHHSACHLLQAALRKVLGPNVQQAGSQVGYEYTRFDFNFERGLKSEELKAVEDQINTWIKAAYPVETKLMRYEDAIKAGALAFFEDKYDTDAEVRVLHMGEASTELCGGTHVSNIGDIASVVIASESSVAAGIRRIKLFANKAATKFLSEKQEAEIFAAKESAEREALALAEKQRKQKIQAEAMQQLPEIIKLSKEEAGRKILIADITKFLPELDADILKSLAEAALKQLGSEAFIALIAGEELKVAMIVAVGDKLSSFNAGNIVREAAKICGGGGGGKPNFAQAGARDSSKIPEALEYIRSTVLVVKA